jgi:single-stranded-DNA-specific exonuclease
VVIKNLKKAANRILKAIKNGEKIILYGDADLDGVTSVIILKETIKNLNGDRAHKNLWASVYFPDREVEGYGISETGLNHLKNFAPAFLVTLDCGISNFKEIKLAKKLGFEVLIIDHHLVLDKLPEAKIIVDPKQKGDKYPFKELATAGIIFKLSELLLKKKMTENLKQNFLELVALATIADMMPREDENQIFIEEGLKSLENSWRPGIRAFFAPHLQERWGVNLNQKVSKMISILNIRDVENNFPASFRLLTSPSLEESKKIISRLIEKSEIRKQKIEEITREIEERISKGDSPIIFEGDSGWDFTLISPVASILCQRYQKPTFIYKILKDESQGTVRVPAGINSVALMKKCSKYPITYGGHPLASGFRIKNENLEHFKKCLLRNYEIFTKVRKEK